MNNLFLLVLLLSIQTSSITRLYAMPTAGEDDEISSEGDNEEEEKPSAKRSSGSKTPEIVAKKLTGPDITELEKTKSILKADNPVIVTLSSDAENKCSNMDKELETMVNIRNQANQAYTDIANKLDDFYQHSNRVIGRFKELTRETSTKQPATKKSIKIMGK